MTTPQERPVLILQHVPWEGPGLIAPALDGLPASARIVVDDADPSLPEAGDLAGLVVMGGPMNADDDARYPGLAFERRLLREAVDADVPTLGVCLGAQLLARALGAAVHPGVAPEWGFRPLTVRAPDPVLDPLGPAPAVLHWHSDSIDLPTGARLLASTATTPVQAFRAGSALGLQFHLEVDAPLLRSWLAVPAMAAELVSAGIDDLPEQAATHLPELQARAARGLAAFADEVRARRS